MYLSEELQQKWGPVLDHPDLGDIKDAHRRAVTTVVLENQEKALREEKTAMFSEATHANATGASIDNYDPILISLVRRAMPNLIAYDVCSVQPMTGLTRLIFAMKSNFTSKGGTEALFNEADVEFSAQNSSANLDGDGDAIFNIRSSFRDFTPGELTLIYPNIA